MNKRTIVGAVLSMALASGIYGAAGAQDVAHTSVLTGTVVSVVPVGTPVKVGDVLVSVQTLAGPMAASRATVAGTVQSVMVHDGGKVTNGEVVAVVDDGTAGGATVTAQPGATAAQPAAAAQAAGGAQQ